MSESLAPPRSFRSIWHDVECGRYTADLELWDELAWRAGAAVLDVGAGTGRVALRLARAGHAVTALDRDPAVLAVLRERAHAAGLRVATVVADASAFDVGEAAFGLVAVPMQTIQLLPDASVRAGFFASARRAVAPGGLVALAIADALEGFEDDAEMPLPDVGEIEGWRFVSQPTAVREIGGGVRIERLRQTIAPGGERTSEQDVVVLVAVTAAELAAEGAAAGLRPESVRYVEPTADHVGAEVVILRG
jgi:SAM-dependent methyltransferase